MEINEARLYRKIKIAYELEQLRQSLRVMWITGPAFIFSIFIDKTILINSILMVITSSTALYCYWLGKTWRQACMHGLVAGLILAVMPYFVVCTLVDHHWLNRELALLFCFCIGVSVGLGLCISNKFTGHHNEQLQYILTATGLAILLSFFSCLSAGVGASAVLLIGLLLVTAPHTLRYVHN